MTEEWRSVDRAPDYEVSSMGRVRRCRPDKYGRHMGRILKPSLNLKGYPFVSLCADGRTWSQTIHKLVCEAFHGPAPTPAHEVAHGDGSRTNNTPDNLRWATRKENFEDRDRHGRTARGDTHFSRLHPELRPRGEEHGNAKLTDAAVYEIRRNRQTLKTLADRFGISTTTISDVRRGRTWRHLLAA